MREDINLDMVLTLSTSDTFHFKSHSDSFNKDENDPACSLTDVKSAKADYNEISLEQALEEDKSYCSKCERWLKRTTDIELYKCRVCEDLNILSPYPFTSIDLTDSPTSSDEGWVCSECITKLWNGMQKVDK